MRRFIVFIALAFLVPVFLSSQSEKPMKRALLIIDIQQFYFVDGSSQLVNPKQASEQAALLLDAFRGNGELVVHIRHASSKDSAIHNNVLPKGDEKVIKKHNVNAYKDTDLLEYLQQNNIEEVVVCGMMTHMCVEAASRASADFDFSVIVIDDACATRDLKHGDKVVKASDVHTSTLATIDRYYGKVMTVNEFLSN